ncbi:MAG: TetR/AcrR family transcriptional regulator [Candidatus Thermoplasmatota archaeon]|nr:TetR/AcrR family transcriptional regulator [Candidatus Thermoplasmatota archaeon]
MKNFKNPLRRRDVIIDTAESLFIGKGFNNTSVDEIVNKLGVAKGTFYYYFKSKEEILDELLNRYLKNIKTIADQIVLSDELNAPDKIVLLFKQISKYSTRKKNIFEYIHKESNAQLHVKYEKKGFPMLIPSFVTMIEQGVKEGVFNTKYPEEAAFAILGLNDTLIGKKKIVKNRIRKWQEQATIFFDFLERILGAKTGTFSKTRFFFDERC